MIGWLGFMAYEGTLFSHIGYLMPDLTYVEQS